MLVPHSDVVEGPQPMEGSIRLLYSRLVFVVAMIEWWRCYSTFGLCHCLLVFFFSNYCLLMYS